MRLVTTGAQSVYIHTNTNMLQHRATAWCWKERTQYPENTCSMLQTWKYKMKKTTSLFYFKIWTSTTTQQLAVFDGQKSICSLSTVWTLSGQISIIERFTMNDNLFTVHFEVCAQIERRSPSAPSRIRGWIGDPAAHTKQVWTHAGACVLPPSGMQKYLTHLGMEQRASRQGNYNDFCFMCQAFPTIAAWHSGNDCLLFFPSGMKEVYWAATTFLCLEVRPHLGCKL